MRDTYKIQLKSGKQWLTVATCWDRADAVKALADLKASNPGSEFRVELTTTRTLILDWD